MTHKDLRDIAAYLGAQYSFEQKLTPFNTNYHDYLVEHNLPSDTQESFWVKVSNKLSAEGALFPFMFQDIRDFKLHLRHISSLTDEEVRHIVSLASDYPIKANDITIYRQDGISFGLDAGITSEGLLFTGDGSDGNEYFTYAEAQVFSYLQSIHVYVPGTIDEQFVELR